MYFEYFSTKKKKKKKKNCTLSVLTLYTFFVIGEGSKLKYI